MDDHTRFVGWDVHKDTIHAAMAERGRTAPEDLGSFPNTPEAVKRWLRRHGERWGSLEQVLVCYAAGPCGYVLCKQLEEQGVVCLVVAPSWIPRRLGDRVKTDRRDALRLASLLRAGELTPVWVPDATHEAFRGLLRAREAAGMDRTRARHRVSKFLLARGHAAPAGTNWGTERHERWLQQVGPREGRAPGQQRAAQAPGGPASGGGADQLAGPDPPPRTLPASVGAGQRAQPGDRRGGPGADRLRVGGLAGRAARGRLRARRRGRRLVRREGDDAHDGESPRCG